MYLLHRPALEDDVQDSCQIGRSAEAHDAVVDVDVDHSPASYPVQHEGDAELDEDDGCAVEDLIEEEPLNVVSD